MSPATSWKHPARVLALALLVLSCTSEEVLMVGVSSVEVVPPTVNAVQGDRVPLIATVYDDQNKELNSAAVEWRSDNPAIASVDANGVLTALQPGSVRVHASFRGVSGSTNVTVLAGPSLAASRDSVAIFSGVGGSPPAEVVSVTNSGTGPLGALSATVEYPPGASSQWLTATLSGTSVPASLTLRASTTGLITGSYAAQVRLAAAGNANELRIAVVLNVTGFIVSQTGASTSVTEGGSVTDTISVVLTARPISNVVFDVSSADVTEVMLSRPSLVFTPTNWNVAQSVTVIGTDDLLDDGDQTTTVTVSVNDGLSDDVFEGLPDQTVSVTTIDNDGPPPRTPGVSVAETGGSTRVTEAGGRDSITVVLAIPPLSNVVLDAVSGDTGESTVSPASLTFTPVSWNVPQVITVTGVDDPADDGDQTATVTISVNDAASEDGFDPLPDQTVAVTTVDDDAPLPPAGITVTESGGSTRVTEAGGSDTISVVLASPPTTNVVLTATSARPAEATLSPASLTFTPATWNVAQNVVVTGVDETVDDGDQTTTVTIAVNDAASDDRYDPLPNRMVTVTTVDDDGPLPPAGFTVTQSGGSTRVTEAGGSDTLSVVLTSPPISPVVLSVTSANLAEATVAPASLTYSPLNWNVPQQVIVRGVDDTVDDGDKTTIVTVAVNDAASDDRYDPVADRTVSVTTVDDDSPPPPAGMTVTESGGGTVVTEAGGTDSVTVVLTSPPASNVVLDVTSADMAEVTVSPASLTFTPANWNVSQRVVATGVDDTVDDGDKTTIVRVAVNDAASDDRYDPLADRTVSVTTVDDDSPPPPAGMTVTESGGSTQVTEAGSTDDIAVVLTSPPTSNVVVDVTSADVAEVTVSPASLTFTPANWNVPQNVVATGVDDTVDDGDQTTIVTVAVNDAASDDRFDPLADRTVSVTTVDDDLPPPPPAGMTVTESGGSTQVTEAGSTDDITVVLTSPPASNVMLDVTSADVAEVTVSPASLTFTPANWNVPQNVVATGVDDTVDDGDQTTTVTIAVNDAASDDRFDPLPDRTVTVTTVDDDAPPPPAGFTVTQSGGSTSVTEAGGTDTLSVVLTSPPLFPVVLSVTSADPAEATVGPASLTYTPLNWDVPQQVVVTGVDDIVDDGDKTTIVTVAVNDGLSDDRFDPVADQTVAVTTVDDDP